MAKQPKEFAASRYYRVRLEHTLKHTQQSTRMIYLVNGAALGALYFAAKLTEIGAYRRHLIVAILVVLVVTNSAHACLIIRQGQWYTDLDTAFAKSSEAQQIERRKGFPWLGTHNLYATIHFILAALLFLAAMLAWFALQFPPQSN